MTKNGDKDSVPIPIDKPITQQFIVDTDTDREACSNKGKLTIKFANRNEDGWKPRPEFSDYRTRFIS